MKPTHPTDRSSGAMVRQAGEVVMVGTQMALPRPAAMTRSTSSGFMGFFSAAISSSPVPRAPRRGRAARG